MQQTEQGLSPATGTVLPGEPKVSVAVASYGRGGYRCERKLAWASLVVGLLSSVVGVIFLAGILERPLLGLILNGGTFALLLTKLETRMPPRFPQRGHGN